MSLCIFCSCEKQVAEEGVHGASFTRLYAMGLKQYMPPMCGPHGEAVVREAEDLERQANLLREESSMLIRLTHTLTRVPFLDSRKCSGEAACGGDRAVRRPLKQETRVARPSRETHFYVSTG